MHRLLHIVLLTCAVLLPAGCDSSERNKTIWEDIKITDLAPSHSGRRPGEASLKTINFDVYIFEMPAENIGTLDDVWQTLHTKPLRFNDYDAFRANSFLIGFGRTTMWDKIAEALRAADATEARTVSLLLLDGQANDVSVTRLGTKQNIFYTSGGGSMEGATIGPGKLALRIRAEKIPGSRGVCKIGTLPVFSPSIGSRIPQSAPYQKSGEFLFTAAGFGLRMSPGDFVFLGPEKYAGDQITLGSLFFSRPGRRPAVRTFLLVCSSINY